MPCSLIVWRHDFTRLTTALQCVLHPGVARVQGGQGLHASQRLRLQVLLALPRRLRPHPPRGQPPPPPHVPVLRGMESNVIVFQLHMLIDGEFEIIMGMEKERKVRDTKILPPKQAANPTREHGPTPSDRDSVATAATIQLCLREDKIVIATPASLFVSGAFVFFATFVTVARTFRHQRNGILVNCVAMSSMFDRLVAMVCSASSTTQLLSCPVCLDAKPAHEFAPIVHAAHVERTCNAVWHLS